MGLSPLSEQYPIVTASELPELWPASYTFWLLKIISFCLWQCFYNCSYKWKGRTNPFSTGNLQISWYSAQIQFYFQCFSHPRSHKWGCIVVSYFYSLCFDLSHLTQLLFSGKFLLLWKQEAKLVIDMVICLKADQMIVGMPNLNGSIACKEMLLSAQAKRTIFDQVILP